MLERAPPYPVGLDQEKPAIKFQGVEPKYTGVFPAKIIHGLLS
jgi:hypothetical protein